MSRSVSWIIAALVSFLAFVPSGARGRAGDPPPSLLPPVKDGAFLRPAAGGPAEPTWGIVGGITVGLWPNPGPRGLVRIYTPYLGQPRRTVMNYVAVEPIVGRVRGLSELEHSKLDGLPGKAMWSVDSRDAEPGSREPWRPARGRILSEDGHRLLSVFVEVEPFDHGARPVIEIRLRDDRPHEVAFHVFAASQSKPMRSCILSATMGNYARLRRVYLRDRVVKARTLYEPFRPVFAGFAAHHEWGLDALFVRDGEALVAATPDEPDPAHATYGTDVTWHWHYQGKVATQYWRSAARPSLVARVNGRRTYWATNASIPGGVAFENFELEAPFEPGQEFCFGVTPEPPAKLGFTSGPASGM
jgi:hypothetical protein